MRVCFFGDSFVNGTGDDSGLGWVGRVVSAARRRGCDLTAYNLGIRGDTTAHIAIRWREEAARRLAPAERMSLVFSFGANDCVLDPVSESRRVDLPSSLKNAEAILGEAQNWLPTMMVGPGIIADDVEATERICDLSDRYAELCKRMAVPYLELSASLIASEVWRRESVSGDGAHPNQHGYELIAEMVEGWRPWQVWTGKALPLEHEDAVKTTP